MGASQPTGRPAQAAPSVRQASSNGAQLRLAASQQRSIKGKACLTQYSSCNVNPVLATSHCPSRPVEARNVRLASSTAVSPSSFLISGVLVTPCQISASFLTHSNAGASRIRSQPVTNFSTSSAAQPPRAFGRLFPFCSTSCSPFRFLVWCSLDFTCISHSHCYTLYSTPRILCPQRWSLALLPLSHPLGLPTRRHCHLYLRATFLHLLV